MNFYINENCVKDIKIEYLNQIDILKYFENHHYQFHVDASPCTSQNFKCYIIFK
jgi:hypothetical protein